MEVPAMAFDREEVESAFCKYEEAVLEAGRTMDWKSCPETNAAGHHVVEGRVHGNPFVDACSITLAPDAASKRAEKHAYESVTASEALAAQE